MNENMSRLAYQTNFVGFVGETLSTQCSPEEIYLLKHAGDIYLPAADGPVHGSDGY